MAFDENPDEVFDNEPEAEAEGNGDEQSNRSFRMMMIGLFAFGALGVLLIALILIGRQGERSLCAVPSTAVDGREADENLEVLFLQGSEVFHDLELTRKRERLL